MKIHELAVVDPRAKLGANVTIGPFAVIGADVTIGDGCEIGAHVVIEGWTEIGAECRFHTGAVIGSPPQDLKYRGEETHLVIGKQNVFREYVTANIGTVGGGGVTQIGDNCLMMAYAHVAHDCQIGNQVILANSVALSGHVLVEDCAIIGGLSALHQFSRVGAHCMIAGCSGVAQDVPPYMMVSGQRARVYSLNSVGLKRRNFTGDAIRALSKAHHLLFRSRMGLKHALERIRAELPNRPEIEHLLTFIEGSQRGICRGISHHHDA